MQTIEGTTKFARDGSNSRTTRFRYTISYGDTLRIWLEDCETKEQWYKTCILATWLTLRLCRQTDALTMSQIQSKQGTVMPGATIARYAQVNIILTERLANCCV